MKKTKAEVPVKTASLQQEDIKELNQKENNFKKWDLALKISFWVMIVFLILVILGLLFHKEIEDPENYIVRYVFFLIGRVFHLSLITSSICSIMNLKKGNKSWYAIITLIIIAGYITAMYISFRYYFYL